MTQQYSDPPFFISANGMRLCVEVRGEPTAPAVLLIMGLGAQMLLWPEEFVDALVAAGYRVIRFDNRDIGQSQKIISYRKQNTALLFMRYKLGRPVRSVDYTLHHMADDAADLLTQLDIEKAHIVGASMGGMIAQLMAAKYPEKTITLTPIMSSTNNPNAPAAEYSLLFKLLKPVKANPSLADLVDRQVDIFSAIQSTTYPMERDELAFIFTQMFQRDPHLKGYKRQLHAILATGDLRPYYENIVAPTLVVHGSQDRLIPPAAGKMIADGIAGARFWQIEDMAHDLPKPLIDKLITILSAHFAIGMQ